MQTLRFSSSSLSKTIVAHFGHLVHKPSGISRFLDFAVASFGFFGKLEFGVGVGGVTAGSPDSNFNVFFVKEVAMRAVIIFQRYLYYSNSASNCPDTNIIGTDTPQDSSAGIRGCARRENVIHQHDARLSQVCSAANREGAGHIRQALLPG